MLPDSIVASSLDPAARQNLRGLAKDVAESVARHLVAAGVLVDEDPRQALAHARYARRRASRIAVVREAAGIAAYHAGEWAEALADLRAARRMGGGPGHLAVMADIERALGRPERAVEIARGPEAAELDRAEQIELAIVLAGARRDLDEHDAAVVALQMPELEPARRDPWSPRLFYAYADNLLSAGRESDALQWFVHAADADAEGETDAAARLAELTGEPLPDEDGIEFDVENLAVESPEDEDSAEPDRSDADFTDDDLANASDDTAASGDPADGDITDTTHTGDTVDDDVTDDDADVADDLVDDDADLADELVDDGADLADDLVDDGADLADELVAAATGDAVDDDDADLADDGGVAAAANDTADAVAEGEAPEPAAADPAAEASTDDSSHGAATGTEQDARPADAVAGPTPP